MTNLLVVKNLLDTRAVLAFIFIYHGLVPKLLYLSPQEVAMIQAHGDFWPVETVAFIGGVAEVVLGLMILYFRRHDWPIVIALAALILLLLDVAIFSPEYLIAAFNPVTTNIASIALCLSVLKSHRSPS